MPTSAIGDLHLMQFNRHVIRLACRQQCRLCCAAAAALHAAGLPRFDYWWAKDKGKILQNGASVCALFEGTIQPGERAGVRASTSAAMHAARRSPIGIATLAAAWWKKRSGSLVYVFSAKHGKPRAEPEVGASDRSSSTPLPCTLPALGSGTTVPAPHISDAHALRPGHLPVADYRKPCLPKGFADPQAACWRRCDGAFDFSCCAGPSCMRFWCPDSFFRRCTAR